jgi:ubiquinone biosynthesis protein
MVMDALGDAGSLNDETMDLDSFRIDLKDMSEQFYVRSIKTVSVFSASTPSPLLYC